MRNITYKRRAVFAGPESRQKKWAKSYAYVGASISLWNFFRPPFAERRGRGAILGPPSAGLSPPAPAVLAIGGKPQERYTKYFLPNALGAVLCELRIW